MVNKQTLIDCGREIVSMKHVPGFSKVVAQKTGHGLVTLDFDGEAGDKMYRLSGVTAHRKTPNGFHIDVRVNGEMDSQGFPGFDVLGKGHLAAVFGERAFGAYIWLRNCKLYETLELSEDLRRIIGW